MKHLFFTIAVGGLIFSSCNNSAKKAEENQNASNATETGTKHYFIDVHNLEPGKVTFADVAAAHQKDLATEGKYNVSFKKFWVDEKAGKVYCLSEANSAADIESTHKEAHGLMPAKIYEVKGGTEAAEMGNKPMFLDVHEMGAGKVTAADVEGAHQKDLAKEKGHDVNFVNYYVDEKEGVIFCLSEAPDSNAVKATHAEAHGLAPAYVLAVKEGK
jgi:hypothetical protein